MKYLTIIATALILSGCATSTPVVENKQTVATTNRSTTIKEPKRRVNLSQAEILCNQSLLPGKEKYSYYCQFRTAAKPTSPLDPNVTVADHSKLAAKQQAPATVNRTDVVTASRGEDDSGAAFFRKQSSLERSSFSLFSNNGMQKPVTVAKNWEGKHAVHNRKELKDALNVDPLSVAWCAAFVNTILKQSGFEGTGSLQARSFLQYGSVTRHPEYGDIVVFSRGRSQWAGHVGFYVGEEVIEGVRYILVLGGNQRKEVNVAYYPANYVLGYRKIG
jgi:uncharacterized protein (TIGR02594 family)